MWAPPGTVGNSASRTQWPEQYLHHVTLDVAPLTLDGLLDSRGASRGEKPERGDLFLKAPAGRGGRVWAQPSHRQSSVSSVSV